MLPYCQACAAGYIGQQSADQAGFRFDIDDSDAEDAAADDSTAQPHGLRASSKNAISSSHQQRPDVGQSRDAVAPPQLKFDIDYSDGEDEETPVGSNAHLEARIASNQYASTSASAAVSAAAYAAASAAASSTASAAQVRTHAQPFSSERTLHSNEQQHKQKLAGSPQPLSASQSCMLPAAPTRSNSQTGSADRPPGLQTNPIIRHSGFQTSSANRSSGFQTGSAAVSTPGAKGQPGVAPSGFQPAARLPHGLPSQLGLQPHMHKGSHSFKPPRRVASALAADPADASAAVRGSRLAATAAQPLKRLRKAGHPAPPSLPEPPGIARLFC